MACERPTFVMCFLKIRPYVNGALYSILALPAIKEEARAMVKWCLWNTKYEIWKKFGVRRLGENAHFQQGICMITSFDYIYQNALRQAIVFSIFFSCEESLVRDTNLHNKDCSEMHSGSCSQMTSSCTCPIACFLQFLDWMAGRRWEGPVATVGWFEALCNLSRNV